MGKKVVYSGSFGNRWHSQVKPDVRRKLNLKKKVKK
jgi:hypothetical protein